MKPISRPQMTVVTRETNVPQLAGQFKTPGLPPRPQPVREKRHAPESLPQPNKPASLPPKTVPATLAQDPGILAQPDRPYFPQPYTQQQFATQSERLGTVVALGGEDPRGAATGTDTDTTRNQLTPSRGVRP